jgi:DNA-binding transcriptional LysR family regulator
VQTLLFKVFRDLAETASFSRAAGLNGITQSAVSQQVKALEKRYDVRLIERGKKSFSLTAEGRVFLGAAREILAVVDGLDTRLRELQALRRQEMDELRSPRGGSGPREPLIEDTRGQTPTAPYGLPR